MRYELRERQNGNVFSLFNTFYMYLYMRKTGRRLYTHTLLRVVHYTQSHDREKHKIVTQINI